MVVTTLLPEYLMGQQYAQGLVVFIREAERPAAGRWLGRAWCNARRREGFHKSEGTTGTTSLNNPKHEGRLGPEQLSSDPEEKGLASQGMP
ncbi:hypothetical protein QYF61_023723 [Mycteria americana]|uniref:Uncharacterized protein n=1 Tax=Mycteria americana TaxID=33587 RepID=A0AAN7RLE6_MYCAM|nr:hypothetical protein QYF61_023723 [Mycteria americana]